MIHFQGFDDWIPIFQGGPQTDSAGRVHDGTALINKAVSTFNAARHEPPAVIGHPVENAPAYGWVEGLKKQGDLLMAKFKQVEPSFADMVKRGLFKKRSAAFYPDGSLRHVGFLGAMPPAVKGLPDVAFAEADALTFEFTENTTNNKDKKEEKEMNFKEFIQKLKDLVAGVDATDATQTGKTFTEADIDAARVQAAEAERQKMASAFAEKERKARQDARKAEISSFCESMVKAGKMTPAMVKFGMPEFMAAFAEKEDVVEFGETKEKATLYDRFKAFFETELPKVVEFREVATRDKDTGGQGQAGSKVEALIRAKMKDNKDLSYGSAFAEVQRENPDLAREYQQEIGG
jgi:hypothetical protein